MEIYNYSSLTGEFLDAGTADVSPMDPVGEDGSQVFIVPGFATPTVPPDAVEGKVRMYRNQAGIPPQNWQSGGWSNVVDYRGAPIYSTADGSVFTPNGSGYQGIGDLPAGLTDEVRPSAAHVWKDDEWQVDDAIETSMIAADVTRQVAVLLAQATAQIEPLQDDFNLGELSAEDEAKLRNLSKYRKDLRAVLTQPGFPRNVTMPTAP